MVAKSRPKTIVELKALFAALGVDVVLLAQRTDGFGERMRAILTAMALADLLAVRFAFRWEGLDRPFGQSSPNAEDVFAPQFLARYHITKEKVGRTAVVRLGDVWKLSENQLRAKAAVAETIFIEVSQSPTTSGLNPGVPDEWFRKIARSAAQIEYAPSVRDAVSAAHGVADSISSQRAPVAIHLRAGDIIYGNHRMLDRFHFKCCPYPIAQHILLHESSQGNQVLLFGQDSELITFLKTTSRAISSTDLAAPFGFSPLQKMVFEVTLMSRCSAIYAGRSGFAILASLIGQVPQVQVIDYARKNALGAFLEAEVHSLRTSQVPPLQVSFAARWAMLLRDEAFPQSEAAVRLLHLCREFDPENTRHALFLACYAQSKVDGEICAVEMEELFGNERFRISDVARHLMPLKHRNPPLPEPCRSVFAKLANLGDRRGKFALALISADMGQIEKARQLDRELGDGGSDHLSRMLTRQLETLG